MTNPKETIIYPSKGKTSALAIGALAFVALCYWFLTDAESIGNAQIIPLPSSVVSIIGLVGLVFFGVCAIYAIYRLFVPKPSLIINEKGITDDSSAISFGFLSWDEIEKIYISNVMNQAFLSILPKNVDEQMKKFTGIKQSVFKQNLSLTGAPYGISTNSLPISTTKLMELMTAHLKK
jgi:hypothetical protein